MSYTFNVNHSELSIKYGYETSYTKIQHREVGELGKMKVYLHHIDPNIKLTIFNAFVEINRQVFSLVKIHLDSVSILYQHKDYHRIINILNNLKFYDDEINELYDREFVNGINIEKEIYKFIRIEKDTYIIPNSDVSFSFETGKNKFTIHFPEIDNKYGKGVNKIAEKLINEFNNISNDYDFILDYQDNISEIIYKSKYVYRARCIFHKIMRGETIQLRKYNLMNYK